MANVQQAFHHQILQVESFAIRRGQYGVKSVAGILMNGTNKQYGYVQVGLNLYDKEGAQVRQYNCKYKQFRS